MKILSRNLFLQALAVLLLQQVCTATEVGLERIIMQLRSEVDSDSDGINTEIQQITTAYLNKYYGAYYSKNQAQGYYIQSDLSVSSLGVLGVEGSFITTLEIDGVLTFDSNIDPPSEPFIDTLLRNAFQGHNEKIYLTEVMKSSNEFLQDLTHIFINIDDTTVAETEIERPSTGSDSATNTESSNSTIPTSVPQTQGSSSGTGNGKRARVTIVTVVVLLVLLGCLCCFRYMFRAKDSTVDDDDDEYNDEPIKVLKLPIKNKKKGSMNSSRNLQQINLSPRSENTTSSSDNSLSDKMGRSPPSPERSLSSQDSSKFTYSNNNNNNYLNNSRISLGSFSRFSMDMQASIDLGGPQRPNTISNGMQVPPFGHDISAIESHRDLSLIEEEDDDEEIGGGGLTKRDARKNNNRRPSSYSSSRRTFEGRHSSRSSRSRPSKHSSSSRMYMYRQDDMFDASIDSDASSDVIEDLKNLSMQIQQQRRSRRAPDPS